MKHKFTEKFYNGFHDSAKEKMHPLYLQILMREFERRMEANERYSLRAFARDLGLNLGHLSRMFRGERVPRKRTARMICQKLALPEGEESSFMQSLIVRPATDA